MKRVVRNVATATVGTAIGNALNVVLPFFVTAWFGAGLQADAYFYAVGTVLFATAAVAMAVEVSTTPYFLELQATDNRSALRAIRRTQWQAAAVSALLTAATLPLVLLVVLPATGISQEGANAVRDLLLLLACLPALSTWSASLAGVLYAYGRFAIGTASASLRSVVALVAGFTYGGEVGVSALAAGLVLGEAMRLAILEFAVQNARRSDEYIRPRPGPESSVDSEVRGPTSFWRTATPLVSMTLTGLSPVVDKSVALFEGSGAVTILELAQRLVNIPVFLILSGLGIVMGARWATYAAASNWIELHREYRRLSRWLFLFGVGLVVVSIPLAFLSQGAAQLFLSSQQARDLAWTFSAAALGIPFALLSQASVRLLISTRQTRMMPYFSAFSVALNLCLDLLLVRWLGLPGIGLTTALVNAFNAVVYGLLGRRLASRMAAGGTS